MRLSVVVTRGDDGSTATYTHDYSDNCGGVTLYPTDPVPLSSLLHPGGNNVRVTMNDACGESVGNSDLFLVGNARMSVGTYTPFLPRYVAMGDSFASGEGTPPYDFVSDRDGCHRSTRAGAVQFAAAPEYGPGVLDIRHVACSGARLTNIYNGQNGELPQTTSLDRSTGLVSISIGGNDLGFSSVLTYCAAQYQLGKKCAGDLDGRMQQYLRALDTPRSDLFGFTPLQYAYRTIHVRAPRAKVLVVGYPRLFSEAGARPSCNSIGTSDQLWINSVLGQGNAIIRRNAEAAGATYVDLASPGVPGSFAGHGLCDSAVNYLNNIILSRKIVAKESFHPNLAGQQAIARALREGYRKALASG